MGAAQANDLLVPELKFVDLKNKMEEIDLLVMFGVGDGSLYRSQSSWLKKGDKRFIVFVEESEECFLQAKGLPLAKDPRVRLLYYKGGEEEIFQQIAWEFVFLRFGYYSEPSKDPEAARAFFLQLEHYHRGVDLLASDGEDLGFRVLTNAFKNLTLLPRSRLGPSLEGKCPNLPAIVCGAGPSLDAAIPFLDSLRDHALIIAGGSAVAALNARGIQPHLAAHIDPCPPHDRFLKQGSFETPFFYQGRLSHEILKKVQAPLVWMPDGGSFPLETWLAAECGLFAERFDGGWTVSNFCTSLALHLGCPEIIFVGMDFSCGPDAAYAANIPGEENRSALIELEKGKLYSKRDWLMSAEWMGASAKRHPSVRWTNASAAGIDLPGIERKELSQVAAQLASRQLDVAGIVHALISEAPRIDLPLEKVATVSKKVRASFEKSLALCDALLKVWEKYYPQSPLEKGDYAVLDCELEQEICHRHYLSPLWNVWKRPILRASFHPLGQHVHQLLFFKKAIEMHLPTFEVAAMTMDQYTLSQNQLIISDQELGIELSLPFVLPRLPLDLKEKGVVKEVDPEGGSALRLPRSRWAPPWRVPPLHR